MKNFQKILIIRLSSVGDVVNVLPALKALRTAYPLAHITWLVEDRARDILYDNPDLDEIVVFPRKKWKNGIGDPASFFSTIFEAAAFFKSLRNNAFDLIIDFQGNLKSGLMTMFSGKGIKLGFESKACKEWNHLFTNRHAHLLKERIHRIDKNLALLKSIGINARYTRPQIIAARKDKEYILDFLNQNTDRKKPLIVIHPGTSEFGQFKRWPASNYARLGDMLIERLNVSVLFTWGPSEFGIVEDIVSLMKQQPVISCRTQSLKQLTEIIGQSSIFISGDTGPMHIASILDKPIVAIFGPKDPVIYGPYAYSRAVNNDNGRKSHDLSIAARVIKKDMPCSPCKKRSCKHNACINTVSPDEVFEASSELLVQCS